MVDRFNAWVEERASDTSLRLASVGGLLATLALIALGAFPSYYTFVAIFAIASPFLFLANIVRPSFLREWHGLRGYAVLCVFLAVAVWLFQIAWLASIVGSR